MSSVLLITEDLEFSANLRDALTLPHIRIRAVTSLRSAKEWLTMADFSLLLVDSRFGEQAIMELMAEGWKAHPYMLIEVFSILGEIPFQWQLQVLGARVHSGAELLKQLLTSIKSLPTRISLGEKMNFAVLVVEDLDAPRDIICSYIEALGFPEVRSAKDATAALELLLKEPLDYFCIVTDLLMPKMNGIELIRKVRANPLISQIPVVVLTAAPTSENFIDALVAGASGFLVKPPKKRLLLAELEKAKRMVIAGQSPRIYESGDPSELSLALKKMLS